LIRTGPPMSSASYGMRNILVPFLISSVLLQYLP
jgi:hypothetical protein